MIDKTDFKYFHDFRKVSSFPENWPLLPKSLRYMRRSLDSASEEYKNIYLTFSRSMKMAGRRFTMIKVQKIYNDYLYELFQR